MTPYYSHDRATIYQGHVLEVLATLPAESVQCAVTSPPYWGLRDYGTEPQEWPEVRFSPMPGIEPVVIPAGRASLGQEPDPMAFVGHLVEVFRQVRRVLKPDGVAWLNLGDSYASGAKGSGGTESGTIGHGHRGQASNGGSLFGTRTFDLVAAGLKPKDLCGIPWRVALALQADGWWLRSEVIWGKPNPMPESVEDRCTRAHEQVFMLAKAERYYYDAGAVAERAIRAGCRPMGDLKQHGIVLKSHSKHATTPVAENRNLRDVWTISSQPFADAHFATMPPELARPPIRATSRPGDLVLDPFTGAATTGLVAVQEGRRFVGCELSADYCAIAKRRLVRILAGEVEALSGTKPEDLGPLFAEGT